MPAPFRIVGWPRLLPTSPHLQLRLLGSQLHLPEWKLGQRVSSSCREESHPVGAIADAFVAYARPLMDQTDGSIDGINRATALAQMCWTLAILPEERRDAAIDKMKPALSMTDEQFAEFRQLVILPMIQRHREMFPQMHGRSTETSSPADIVFAPTKNYPGTGRNAPCPCGSGRKYKRCCGVRK